MTVSREKILYGSVNQLATDVDNFYGSVLNKSRQVSKIYGSLNGQAKLVYLNLGKIPSPGRVVFYTDTSYTTTDTAKINSQADVDLLCGNSSSYTISLDGKTITNTLIKEVYLPESATTTPTWFLRGCSKLDTLDIPYSITSIGHNFLQDCTSFNQALDLTFVTAIATYFLQGCRSYNQPINLPSLTSLGMHPLDGCTSFNKQITIPQITSIPTYFLTSCSSFNQTIDLSNVTTIGEGFLKGCTAYNKALSFATVTTIGDQFLYGCTNFNQPMTIPNTVQSIGTHFLYNCKNMISAITCNAPASIAESSNYTFSTADSSATSYTTGTSLGGRYSTEWITKFPTRTTDPYRKTGYAHDPRLLDIVLSEDTLGTVKVQYGVESWDMNGTYTSGNITLYGGTSANPTTQIDSYSNTGLNVYNHTGRTGNTRYYYRASATNNGNLTVETDNSIVTKPASMSVASLSREYESYNVYVNHFRLSIPANGNTYTQTLAYRVKASGDSDYGNWTTIDTYSSASSGTKDVDITLATNDTYSIQFRTTTTAGSTTTTYSESLFPTHQGPTNVQYTLSDFQTSVQDWLATFDGYSSNNWFISGQSQPRVTIPASTSGTTTDGATMFQYEAIIVSPDNGISHVINYSPSNMVYTFNKASLASTVANGDVQLDLVAKDSLNATNTFTKTGRYMTWATPTFVATASRANAIGQISLNMSGTYSGIQDSAINSGNDLNNITLEYRVLDYSGAVLRDWTTVQSADITINQLRAPVLNRSYSASFTAFSWSFTQSIRVQMRMSDHFYTSNIESISLNVWDNGKTVEPADYTVELWDWKTNTFVADLSQVMVDNLEITWELNDIEEVSFSIDLLEFENRCREMGVEPEDLLKPYVHDIRIRRNGEYIVGCQLVEASTKISNNPPVRIAIKGTGYLNLFKDQYILNEAWSGYTYAEIARKLVSAAQMPDPIIKNPTCDIDTSYWLAANGTISSSQNSHSGARCLMVNRSGTGWMTAGTQMKIDPDTNYKVDAWVKAQNGATVQVVERRFITEGSTQRVLHITTGTGNWQHIQLPSCWTQFKNGYIDFECNRTDSSTPFYVDDVYIYPITDETPLNNLNVSLGTDTASATQDNTREVNYELQNVKDALMDLVSMEDDNFDFEFMPDRTFNIYDRKGSDKLGLEITYPGNVDSMTISRSAANLTNKIIQIGSGIGDERLQVEIPNNVSRQLYGTRESVITNSNVSLESTLTDMAVANLYDSKDPANLPSVTIKDGSINPANVQTGDTVLITLEAENYLASTTGEYRIAKIRMSLDDNAVESMTLTLEKPTERPEKQMVRYIRDSMVKTTSDNSCIWEEIQGLMLVGNDYVNVAQGATVYGSTTWHASDQTGLNAVDGNINTWAQMQSDGTNRVAITIDLGDEYPLDYVKIWHYWPDGRKCIGEHLSVGTTLPDSTTGTADLEKVLIDFGASSIGHPETSDGHLSAWIQEHNVVWGGE